MRPAKQNQPKLPGILEWSVFALGKRGVSLLFLKEPAEVVYFLARLAGTILCKEVKIINVKARGYQASDPHPANTAEDLAKNAVTGPCMSSTLF